MNEINLAKLSLSPTMAKMVGANGEINASSKKDLLQAQVRFMQANDAHRLNLTSEQSRQYVEAAFNDKDVHRVLGEKIADALYLAETRTGFARKFLTKHTVANGGIPRFPLRQKNVYATFSTSPTRVETQITRDKWFTPPEFELVARPFITQVELASSPGDVLQEKFVEATEAIMVAEDKSWYNQANALVGVDNPLTQVGGGLLTPYILTSVAQLVARWGLKHAHCLMATDLWQDITGQSDFYNAIDPVARHELLLTGELAIMYGMTITTDAFRHPEHKVLNKGEFFVISDPLNHGAYSDRGGIISSPIDQAIEGKPGRGWMMSELWAVSISNSRSIAKGIR